VLPGSVRDAKNTFRKRGMPALYESLLRVNQPTASEAISGGIVCPPSNSR